MGLDVDPGLVELLLRDLGDTAPTAGEGGMTGYEAGRLPLLAHALRVTWQQRHGHTLTVEGYRISGGIHRAVATTAGAGFRFDSAGNFTHLFDPATGRSPARYRSVSVIAPTATEADALSTAFCLMPPTRMREVFSARSNVQLRDLTQDVASVGVLVVTIVS